MLGNAGKHVIISSFQSKLYKGHIHTLVLTREWIAMLHSVKLVLYTHLIRLNSSKLFPDNKFKFQAD